MEILSSSMSPNHEHDTEKANGNNCPVYYHAQQESLTIFNRVLKWKSTLHKKMLESTEPKKKTKDEDEQQQQLSLASNLEEQEFWVQLCDLIAMQEGKEVWAHNKNLFEIAHETDCLAYFSMRMQIADNRGFPNDKVLLIGSHECIIKAKKAIRDHTPITIIMLLNTIKDEYKKVDLSAGIREWIAELNGKSPYKDVQFGLFRKKKCGEAGNKEHYVVVRSSAHHYQELIDACEAIDEFLTGKKKHDQKFLSILQVPAWERTSVIWSPEGELIQSITSQTHTKIYFNLQNQKGKRDDGDGCSVDGHYVFTAGEASNVIAAVQLFYELHDKSETGAG